MMGRERRDETSGRKKKKKLNKKRKKETPSSRFRPHFFFLSSSSPRNSLVPSPFSLTMASTLASKATAGAFTARRQVRDVDWGLKRTKAPARGGWGDRALCFFFWLDLAALRAKESKAGASSPLFFPLLIATFFWRQLATATGFAFLSALVFAHVASSRRWRKI